MADDIKLYLNDTALNHLLKSPSGEVGQHMAHIGDEVIAGAQVLAGARTGSLKRSLRKTQKRETYGQSMIVGAYVSHALEHHEGTRPHIIRPDHGRVLRFNNRGRIVFARVVFHPGSRGRKYLTIPLQRAVR